MGRLRDRGWRRHQSEKRKKKWVKDRLNAWGEMVDYLDGNLREWIEDPKNIGLQSKTPCRCSCYLCEKEKKYKRNRSCPEIPDSSELNKDLTGDVK